MSAIGEIAQRGDRPAYVTFERIAVEDKAESTRQGHYVAKDVDYVNVTPAYSKDMWKSKVPQWLDNMKSDVMNGRLPQEWMDAYLRKYEAWKNGQALPLEGTAIKGWGVISPAQQEILLRMNILTVEDLAGINDEGLKRIGMGAMELKNKARAWIAQLNDKGPLTIKMASIEQENALLRGTISSLEAKIEKLARSYESTQARVIVDVPRETPGAMEMADILPETTTGAKGDAEPPARPPKRRSGVTI